jgi:AsmA protein
MKKVFIAIGVVILLLIVVALALPFMIDVNRFKPTLEADLSTALGRKVEIGNIQLSILSGAVTVDNVSIADDPAFSNAPFLQAKQLAAGIAIQPLIFSKKLQVSSFTITQPQVVLLHAASGKWNYSSLGATSRPASSGSASASPGSGAVPSRSGASSTASSSTGSGPANSGSPNTDFTVDKIKIENGTVSVGRIGPGGKTQTYQNVNLEIDNVSYTSAFPFQLDAKTPGNGSIKADGKAGPINATDSSLTPLSAKLNVENVDLASTGFVDPSSGLAGLVSFNGDIASDGKQMTSKGNVKADKVKLVANGSPSHVPLTVDYDTKYDLATEIGDLSQGDVHIGKALAHLGGTYDISGATAAIKMKLAGKNMPVTDLEGVMPAVGVTLPTGSSLSAGGLDLNLSLDGPVDKLIIAGPVNLSNAKLAGFNLKQKLGPLASLIGIGAGESGNDTDIQTLSADVRVDPQGTQAKNLNLIVPAIGTITGNGTVSATQQLDAKLVAKVVASGGAVGSVAAVLGGASTGGSTGGKSTLTVPVTVKGTTSNPQFIPDMSSVVKNNIGNIANLGANLGKSGTGNANDAAAAASSILGGFLNKKKK